MSEDQLHFAYGQNILEFAFELWRSPGVRGVQVFAGMLSTLLRIAMVSTDT